MGLFFICSSCFVIKSLDVSILSILSLMGCSAASILDAIFCNILLFNLRSSSSNSGLSWIDFTSWDVWDVLRMVGLSWDKGGVVSSALAIFAGIFLKVFYLVCLWGFRLICVYVSSFLSC